MDININPLSMCTVVVAFLVFIEGTYRDFFKALFCKKRAEYKLNELTSLISSTLNLRKEGAKFSISLQDCTLAALPGWSALRLLSKRESVPFLSNSTFNFAFPGILMFALKIKAK